MSTFHRALSILGQHGRLAVSVGVASIVLAATTVAANYVPLAELVSRGPASLAAASGYPEAAVVLAGIGTAALLVLGTNLLVALPSRRRRIGFALVAGSLALGLVTLAWTTHEVWRASQPVVVDSTPPGAQVFLGYQAVGVTPQSVPRDRMQGRLVVTLPGYRPTISEVSSAVRSPLVIVLKRLEPESHGALLLVPSNLKQAAEVAALRRELIAAGLRVADDNVAARLALELPGAGGTSNRALQARLLETDGVSLLGTVELSTATRAATAGGASYPGLTEGLKDIWICEARVHVELTDVRTGEAAVQPALEARTFGADRSAISRGALRELASQLAGTLRPRI